MFNSAHKPAFWQTLVRRCLSYLPKFLTHNYCDSCGWTKNELYVTKMFSEEGFVECSECIMKPIK